MWSYCSLMLCFSWLVRVLLYNTKVYVVCFLDYRDIVSVTWLNCRTECTSSLDMLLWGKKTFYQATFSKINEVPLIIYGCYLYKLLQCPFSALSSIIINLWRCEAEAQIHFQQFLHRIKISLYMWLCRVRRKQDVMECWVSAAFLLYNTSQKCVNCSTISVQIFNVYKWNCSISF